MQRVFLSYALQTFCDLAMGWEQDFLNEKSPYEVAFEECNRVMMLRFIYPETLAFKSLLQHERDHKKNVKVCEDQVYEMIDKKRNEISQETLLDIYSSATDDKGNQLSRKYIRDAILSLLFAGCTSFIFFIVSFFSLKS